MKVELLLKDCNEQVLPISEGNSGDLSQFKPCKGINLTTRHTRARSAPQVATVHNVVKETIRAHLTLMHIFHVLSRRTHRGWPMHYPILHPLGMVG
jgi:hypothetical protein